MLKIFTLILSNANIINMTYTLKLTPYLAALLDAACRAAGLDTLNIFPATLNRYTATEQGPTTTTTTDPGSTEPAPVARLTTPAPTPAINLNRPGDILTADPTTDWTDPALYA